MIVRLADWYLSTRHPAVAGLREFVRRHRVLRRTARSCYATIRFVASAPGTIRGWLSPIVDPKLSAIMSARSVGGSISVTEMEELWLAGTDSRRALCLGSPKDLEQMSIMLHGGSIRSIDTFRTAADVERAELDPGSFDLVVAGPVAEDLQGGDRIWIKPIAGQRLLRVGTMDTDLTAYCKRDGQAAAISLAHRSAHSFQDRLTDKRPLRVVFLCDCGFQFGAGVALRRQVASFLLNGWNVAVVAWLAGDTVIRPSITGLKQLNNWLGIHELSNIHAKENLSDEQIAAEVISMVHSLTPDIVIVGNIHGAGWPIGILAGLRSLGLPTVAYMHDCYWITGRCAQPVSCTKFRNGCDASCPTPHERPRLAPEKIAGAWSGRADVFTGPSAIPLIANSSWTRDMVLQRFGDAATTDIVHLGIDHKLFAPISKSAARRLLKIPSDKLVVAMGAVDVRDRWKGGPLFHAVHRALLVRTDVNVVLFGQSSEELSSTKSFGLVQDERLMPFILNAADIFVSTGTVESFGQTLLEASACGLPVVAYNVGGVKDVVVNGETGLLVDGLSTQGLLAAVDRLVSDPAERDRMGRNGRARVENHFTLEHQANAWIDCLNRLC